MKKNRVNRLRASFLATLLPLALLGACSGKDPLEPRAQDESTSRTENVVLVIIDGLRYSEGLGDPLGTNVPRMQELAARGALIEPFLNDGVTVTRRAIPAIWSGSWLEPVSFDDSSCPGISNQRAVAPTVFEYFRKHLGRSEEDCVYLVGSVGCPWRASLDAEYGSGFWPRYETRGNSDLERWDIARGVLATTKPGFFLFYLPDVDHAGHAGDWNAYLSAIRVADQIVGDLWDTLQADPHYAGVTTMLVTNDHGRHDNRPNDPHDGFNGHGDGCAGCRTIQLLAIGPDVRSGLVSDRPRAIPDIVPTIGVLLGFPTEQATGTPALEILTPGSLLAADPVSGLSARR